MAELYMLDAGYMMTMSDAVDLEEDATICPMCRSTENA